MLPDPIVCGAGLREGEAEVAAGVRGGGGMWREQRRWSRRQVRAGERTTDSVEALMAATAQRVREDDRGQNRGALLCGRLQYVHIE
jgi:hypothetical protein